MGYKTKLTEKVKCGQTFDSIKLKEETKLCCPMCKNWSTLKDLRGEKCLKIKLENLEVMKK